MEIYIWAVTLENSIEMPQKIKNTNTVKVLVAQSCLTVCDPTDCSFFVHGILQARILEWVAIPSSKGSFWPRDWTCIPRVSWTAGRFFTSWAIKEATIKSSNFTYRNISKGFKYRISERYLPSHVHCSIIHNRQVMKATMCLSKDEWIYISLSYSSIKLKNFF